MTNRTKAKTPLSAGLKQPRLASLFAIFFLLAQIFTTAHVAAYGESEHSHEGHPCIIAAAVKQADDIDCAPASFTLGKQANYIFKLNTGTKSIAFTKAESLHARAPPFSLS